MVVGKSASAIAAWRPDTVQFAIGVALVCVTMFGADLGGNLYWIHIFRELGIFLSVSVLLNFPMSTLDRHPSGRVPSSAPAPTWLRC